MSVFTLEFEATRRIQRSRETHAA
jgi:hypothetical protein